MIVLDASALIELLLNTEPGRRLAKRIADPRVMLHAPHLVDLEVAQTLRRYVLHGEISDERAQIALQHLTLLDLNRYAHSDFLTRIWALKDNVSAYDGAYVSLAEALGATLVTGDRRLTKASGTRAVIELLV